MIEQRSPTHRLLWVAVVVALLTSSGAGGVEAPPHFVASWSDLGAGQLSAPEGVGCDLAGNIYVADTDNHRVQKFDVYGNLSNFWGSEGSGPGQFDQPGGVAATPGGLVYVIDTQNHRVQKFNQYGTFLDEWGSMGGAVGQFRYPQAAAVGPSGNLYVADRENDRIQVFDPSGVFLSARGSAGTGPGEFNSPYGVGVGSDGTIYVADTNNHRIQKFASDWTFLGMWGVYGTAPGELRYPRGVAADSAGNVFVADTNNDRIQKFDSDGTFLSEWSAGSYPHDIAADSAGSVFVVDRSQDSVSKFSGTGQFLTLWGSYGPATSHYPRNIATDAAGKFYITEGDRVLKLDPTGTILGSWGTAGTDPGQYNDPHGVFVDIAGNIYVADTYNHRIQKFSSDWTFLGMWGVYGVASGEFRYPRGVAADSAGNVFVADTNNDRVQKFDSTGTFLEEWGVGILNHPIDIAVDTSDYVYLLEGSTGPGVIKLDSDLSFITQWGSSGNGPGEFSSPDDVSVDAMGNVYVADTSNDRIQKFDNLGGFLSEWGEYGEEDGQFRNPRGVAADTAGNVFVSDYTNRRIQKFSYGYQPGPLPDLIPASIGVVPSTISAGQSATVYFTVYNGGDAPAGETLARLRLSRSSLGNTLLDPVLVDVSTPALGVGESVQLSTDVTIPANAYSGTHYVWVILDNFSAIQQSNTENDFASRMITVDGVPGPPGPFTLWGEDYCDTQPPGPSPGVRLNWSPAAGVETYSVYRDGLAYAGPFPPEQLSFLNNDGVTEGQTYTYYIEATNAIAPTESNTETVTVSGNVCNPLDHFDFGGIDPQTAGEAFQITIIAKDAADMPADYTGPVTLVSTVGLIDPGAATVSDGMVNLFVKIDTPGQGVRLLASGGGASGESNPFDIAEGLGCAAQSNQCLAYGDLQGTVASSAGSRLAAASVFLKALDGTTMETQTDAEGRYSFQDIPCGEYSIWASQSEQASQRYRINVQCGLTLVFHLVVLECEHSPDNLHKHPVLLVPGLPGSSIPEDASVIPRLPKHQPAWNDSAWGSTEEWFSGDSWGGLFDPAGARPGWQSLAKKLSAADEDYGVGCRVFPVPYDWRIPPDKVVTDFLIPAKEYAKAVAHSDKVHVVAHSTGALVVRSYIQGVGYQNDIDKFALVGAPNMGATFTYYLWQGSDPKTADSVAESFWSEWKNFYAKTSDKLFETHFGRSPGSRDRFRTDMFDLYQAYVKSLQYLLPTYEVLDPGGSLSRCGEQWQNSWLDGLNQPGEILSHFGDGSGGTVNTRIYASTSEETVTIVEVGLPNCSSAGKPILYPDGKPKGHRDYSGDGTVPEKSSSLGLLDVNENKDGKHSKLIGIYENELCAFLLDDNPQCGTQEATRVAPQGVQSVLSVTLSGRAQPYLVDSDGDGSGIDPDTGHWVDEIPGSSFHSGSTGAAIRIVNPVEGVYSLALSSEFEEDYRLEINYAVDGEAAEVLGRGFYSTPHTIDFDLSSMDGPEVTVDHLPLPPTGLRADALASPGLEVRLSWAAHPDPGVTAFNIYSKLETAPKLAVLGSTSASFFDTTDPWAESAAIPTRVYAISAAYSDGSESFLSEMVLNNDRDHDGLTDEEEWQAGTDLWDSDSDGDGLSDGEEALHGTNPLLADTDGDGYTDLEETDWGFDPLDGSSFPVDLVLADQIVTTAKTFRACNSIEAGSDFRITAPADVEFRAGDRIVLSDGFSVESGARFATVIDPLLACP